MKSQTKLFKNSDKCYGGTLLNTRKGRSVGRPLATKKTIHMVLRSSQATGEKAFNRPKNKKKIREIINKFAAKYGVTIVKEAINVNHLHHEIQLSNRFGYYKFIRAVTSAIAMAITGINRWTKDQAQTKKFWDHRPFTRVVMGYRDSFKLKEYIEVNQLEGLGVDRFTARNMIANKWKYVRDG